MKKIPSQYSAFFWDSNLENMSLDSNKSLIIERLAILGDMSELEWLERNFTNEEISDVIKSSRSVPPAVAHYFSLRYGFPFEQTTSFQQTKVQNFSWY